LRSTLFEKAASQRESGGEDMEKIRVEKKQLISDLKKNRSKHRAIFEQAVEGYRNLAVQQLTDHVKRIQKGKLVEVYVRLPLPEDHTRDYDRVIQMLERSLDETVFLSEADFRAYVQDDWDWKRAFLTSNATYSAVAAEALEAYPGSK
jgi:hypothetical protein